MVSCYRAEPGGIVLTVRLTPRADRDAIESIGVLADGQMVALARVRAVPEDGAANAALIALVSKIFRRPKSAVRISAGASARVKQLRIAGEPVALAAVVESWVSGK